MSRVPFSCSFSCSLWYDAFNDLIGRTLTPYSGGVAGTPTTARFVYDLASGSILPSPLVGEGSGVRGSGDAVLAFTGNESLTDRYLWGPAVDQILSDERFAPSGSNWMPTTSPGNVYFALGDNEGSVRDWITYGSLVDHVVYDSFGKIYSQSSTSVPFNFMHNGVFYDSATGLEYHSQSGTGVPGRWYNPAIQRWMSEDPTGLKYDSNPYRSDYNSPTNYIDPSGLDATFGGGDGIVGLQQQEWQQEARYQQWLKDTDGGRRLLAGMAGGSFFDMMNQLAIAAYGGFCEAAMYQYQLDQNARNKTALAMAQDPNDTKNKYRGMSLADYGRNLNPNYTPEPNVASFWNGPEVKWGIWGGTALAAAFAGIVLMAGGSELTLAEFWDGGTTALEELHSVPRIFSEGVPGFNAPLNPGGPPLPPWITGWGGGPWGGG